MDTQTFCNACGGSLKLRLGQWECAQCGAVAGTGAAQSGATTAQLYNQRAEQIAAQDFQYFSRENNVRAKRWCVAIYALFIFFPYFVLVAGIWFLLFGMQMLMGSD